MNPHMDNDSPSIDEYSLPTGYHYQRRNAVSGASSGNLSRSEIGDLHSGRGIYGDMPPPPDSTHTDNYRDTVSSNTVFTMPQWSEDTDSCLRQQATRLGSEGSASSEIESDNSSGVALARMDVDVGPHDEVAEDRGGDDDDRAVYDDVTEEKSYQDVGSDEEEEGSQDDQDQSESDGSSWEEGELVQIRAVATFRTPRP